MKKITALALIAATLAITSCTKERTYLCTITTYTPRGISPKPDVKTVPFTGTYAEMKAFEAANTTGDPNAPYSDAPHDPYQTCDCK